MQAGDVVAIDTGSLGIIPHDLVTCDNMPSLRYYQYTAPDTAGPIIFVSSGCRHYSVQATYRPLVDASPGQIQRQLIDREYYDAGLYIILTKHLTFPESARVTAWKVFAEMTGTTHLQVNMQNLRKLYFPQNGGVDGDNVYIEYTKIMPK